MFWPLLLLIVPIWLGGYLGSQRMPMAWVKKSNAFSGAFLFAITVFLWLPHLTEHSGHEDHEGGLPWGVWIVLGYFLQFALDSSSKGLEHGHIHGHDNNPWPAYIGLLIHSLVEGLPLFSLDVAERMPYAISLAVHNLPIAALLAFWLKQCNIPVRHIIFAIVGLSIAAPIGGALGGLIPADMPGMESFVGGLVVGIFLHVSSTILFELQKDHRMPWRTWAIVIIGLASGYALSLLH
jgi:zinc and cadmium transporter